MLVSVIIPVYNVEKYINRCLKSVHEQTYNDMEIILVDDGSTDDSGRICDTFANTDNRTIVIHKENGGLSSARNAGLRIARGEYITFLDSDDYLSINYIQRSLELCLSNKAEISIMKMEYIQENENDEKQGDSCVTIKCLTTEDAIKESLYQRMFSCCAPGKMYFKDTLNGIVFLEGKLSEDLAVCHLIINNAHNIIYCDEIGYYYRQQENSIMHVFNERRIDALDWAHNIEQFCTVHYPSLNEAAICRTFNVAIHLALDLPKKYDSSSVIFERIWGEIRRTRISVLKNNEARKREKIAALLSYLGPSILARAWNSKLAIKK